MMRYAFNTWPYASFPTWLPAYPLEETIRRLAKIGYDGIEIGCCAPHAWPAYLSKARRQELRKIMDGEGLPAISLLPAPGGGPGFNPSSPDIEERQATVAQYKDVIDLAADFGAGLVLYIAGWQIFGTTRAEAWSRSLDCLGQIAPYAAERNVVIAIEPTPTDGNLVETGDEALEMMRAIGGANVKVMLDTSQSLYRREVPSDEIRALGAHLVHIHVADVDRRAPGDGAIDWSEVIRAVDDIGFNGYLTMEIGFVARGSDPDSHASRALKYMKEIERRHFRTG
jgi:protein FrlC